MGLVKVETHLFGTAGQKPVPQHFIYLDEAALNLLAKSISRDGEITSHQTVKSDLPVWGNPKQVMVQVGSQVKEPNDAPLERKPKDQEAQQTSAGAPPLPQKPLPPLPETASKDSTRVAAWKQAFIDAGISEPMLKGKEFKEIKKLFNHSNADQYVSLKAIIRQFVKRYAEIRAMVSATHPGEMAADEYLDPKPGFLLKYGQFISKYLHADKPGALVPIPAFDPDYKPPESKAEKRKKLKTTLFGEKKFLSYEETEALSMGMTMLSIGKSMDEAIGQVKTKHKLQYLTPTLPEPA
jgi:hypothetical protein